MHQVNGCGWVGELAEAAQGRPAWMGAALEPTLLASLARPQALADCPTCWREAVGSIPNKEDAGCNCVCGGAAAAAAATTAAADSSSVRVHVPAGRTRCN